MNIINEKDWAKEACNLLKEIEKIPPEQSIILLLRHSHRAEVDDKVPVNDLALTNEGQDAAYEFGTFLPYNRQIRIYHSEIGRCIQTAKYIEKGVKQNGQIVSELSEMKILTGMAGVGSQIFLLVKRDKRDAILKWAAGHYPPSVIEPLPIFAQRAAYFIYSKHLERNKPTLDIFISHDLHIMGLQFGWMGYYKENEWVNYLGGFIFLLNDSYFEMIKNNNHIKVKKPYWWPVPEIDMEKIIVK